MFKCLNFFGRKQQGFTNPVPDELTVKLRMPDVYRGKVVPPSIVVMELLWQQYGLDVLHPEFSRWVEKNAPDITAATKDHFINHFAKDNGSHPFRVGSQGTVELNLSLAVDDRLREISFQYILSQVRHTIEPETEPQLAA